jgi:hypothetical protein
VPAMITTPARDWWLQQGLRGRPFLLTLNRSSARKSATHLTSVLEFPTPASPKQAALPLRSIPATECSP